ncbi:hypothetical protein B0I37DRAFT_386723 [Chaetomium sp. MPI-CAGE-AT-0009]|nr:hypothetical protein B0I37DRAFT_386723 [Chaetomium sp. MPI-CAGE-AT-0009]
MPTVKMDNQTYNPFAGSPSDFLSTSPGSPNSFHSAKEWLASEDSLEMDFNCVNYNFEALKLNRSISSGPDPLLEKFDPDATRLMISQTTFEEDSCWDPWYTTDDPAPVGNEPEWEWISAPEGQSGEASSNEEWEVRDVTPRESWKLRTLDPAMSTSYRRRSLELDYGVEEVVPKTSDDSEDHDAPKRIESDADGQSRASISGMGLPVVTNAGVVSTSSPANPSGAKKGLWVYRLSG